MARSILMDTDTVSLGDLIGNGRVFRVPPFQRDYSWRVEQWDDLWEDLLGLEKDADARHYMGALVVEKESEREYQIIDGQQRIATLSVMALAVIARLEELASEGVEPEHNRERSERLRWNYIGKKDPVSLTEASRLRLNATDDGFYQDYLVQLSEPLNVRALPKSNQLLWGCFQYFKRKMVEMGESGRSGERLARMLSDVAAQQLLFTLIKVDDELSAYSVFETLNARGLGLSPADLLKNYLFSRIQSKPDLAWLQRQWGALVNTVGQDRLTEFLRYHLLCEHPKIRQGRVFQMIRERVKSNKDVFGLLNELKGRAELFSALSDEGHGYWVERPVSRAYIRVLKLFGVRQMTPLLFAAFEKLSAEDFARVLKLVCVISFRYTVVGGLNTNELEPVYHQAAKALLTESAKTPAEVFRALRGIYVEDAKFEADFAGLAVETQGRKKKLVKYVLCRLEGDVRGQELDWENDGGTIEHVLPENAGEEWVESIDAGRWDEYMYRLGNLTLLEGTLNRRCGGASFAEKAVVYGESGYEMTRAMGVGEEWTVARIEARQWEMARRAAHVWRSDFA